MEVQASTSPPNLPNSSVDVELKGKNWSKDQDSESDNYDKDDSLTDYTYQGDLSANEEVKFSKKSKTASPFPNFVEHASKQKLSKLREKKEIKKQEKLKEIRKKREEKAIKQEFVEPTTSTRSSPTTSNGLLKRRQLFRDEFLDLQCEWKNCSATESRMEDFMKHVATHVVQAEVIHNPPPLMDSFACLWNQCGFETINSRHMVRHINFHAFHTKVKCHGRNMLLINNMLPCKLDSTQRNILPDLSEPFRCDWKDCHMADFQWDMAQSFYWHVKGHAEDLDGLTTIQCGWIGCDRSDSAVSKLKEHLRCHSQERMVGCPTCGGLFANRVKFMDHCLKQQEGHSFACMTCEKKFAIERHLRDHMRSHVNHYKCPHCDMTCPTPSTLTSHIKYRHTTEKPFACEFCHYRGKTMADIKSHLRVHYNEVKVTCPEPNCEFSCRAKITMKQHHETVHMGNIPKYACHVCEEKYFKGADLTKHLVKVHSFSTPSGHSRFRYTKDSATGLFRLQTVRFESLDVLDTIPHLDVNHQKGRGRGRGKKTVVRAEPVYQKTGEPAPAVPEAATAELEQDVKIEITDELIDIVSQQDVQVFAVGADGVETNDMVSMAMMAAMDNQEPTVQVNEFIQCTDIEFNKEAFSNVIVIPVSESDLNEADLVHVEDKDIENAEVLLQTEEHDLQTVCVPPS